MKTSTAVIVRYAVLGIILCAALTDSAVGKQPGPKPKPVPGPFKFPKEITPTPEQEAKRDALMDKFAPQQEALAKREKEIYTPEQEKKMKEVREAARAEGLKGKEANERVEAAVQLSGGQRKKLEQLSEKRKALDEQIKAAMWELLTPEQKKSAKQPGKPKRPPEKKSGKPKG